MNGEPDIRLRIGRSLYDHVLSDLRRPHPFAFERVGFLYATSGNVAGDPYLALAVDYDAVADADYVNDPTCGARIGSDAIRRAMQRVLSTNVSAFHVHVHEHRGTPALSRTDRRGLPGVVEALRNACPQQAHGLVVLSKDHGIAEVWLPGSDRPRSAGRVTIVGAPMASFARCEYD
ncbi:MAG TPA: hypothetical protein VGM51_07100 [Armatimonadota bacterium]|jgi:hypothetical protein